MKMEVPLTLTMKTLKGAHSSANLALIKHLKIYIFLSSLEKAEKSDNTIF